VPTRLIAGLFSASAVQIGRSKMANLDKSVYQPSREPSKRRGVLTCQQPSFSALVYGFL
jgi:hypothetical protein